MLNCIQESHVTDICLAIDCHQLANRTKEILIIIEVVTKRKWNYVLCYYAYALDVEMTSLQVQVLRIFPKLCLSFNKHEAKGIGLKRQSLHQLPVG